MNIIGQNSQPEPLQVEEQLNEDGKSKAEN